jgi:hypothetical protein
LEGLSIAVLATPFDARSLARIALRPGRVKVILGSGSGSEYHERAFEGTGVTSFDSARGARIDSTLSETAPPAGSTKGTIGTITAISGSVDCGNQTRGTSTVRITGSTAEGALTAAVLDPVRAECDETPDGTEVVASGLANVGATRALVALGLTTDGSVTVDVTVPGRSHHYVANGSSTITSTGGHVRADVVEQKATPARTLHVEGDLTCGVNASG